MFGIVVFFAMDDSIDNMRWSGDPKRLIDAIYFYLLIQPWYLTHLISVNNMTYEHV